MTYGFALQNDNTVWLNNSIVTSLFGLSVEAGAGALADVELLLAKAKGGGQMFWLGEMERKDLCLLWRILSTSRNHLNSREKLGVYDAAQILTQIDEILADPNLAGAKRPTHYRRATGDTPAGQNARRPKGLT